MGSVTCAVIMALSCFESVQRLVMIILSACSNAQSI